MSLDKICLNKESSKTQLEQELKESNYGLNELDNGNKFIIVDGKKFPKGCSGYLNMGCYSCDGKNDKCEHYFLLQQ